MRKLIKRRPSAGTLIAFVALCVALGGGAYAATSHTKIAYKGLSKDARLKVLPVSVTNANAGDNPPACDPTTATTFTDCTSVNVDGSTQFKRKYVVTFDGVFTGGGSPANGECRLELDNAPLQGTKTNVHSDGSNAGFGINIVANPTQGGKHTISAACNETSGDLKVPQFELSAISVR
jgi:hypothetical protein